MSAVSFLESMGLSLSLAEGGKVVVCGLKSLDREGRAYAVRLAQEHKSAIVEALQGPTPAQLAHARRMLVTCPATGGKVHCWHCSRCPEARTCLSWRVRRSDVESFRQSEEPFSLFLVKEDAPGVLQ
jgi:hypothetical protein